MGGDLCSSACQPSVHQLLLVQLADKLRGVQSSSSPRQIVTAPTVFSKTTLKAQVTLLDLSNIYLN